MAGPMLRIPQFSLLRDLLRAEHDEHPARTGSVHRGTWTPYALDQGGHDGQNREDDITATKESQGRLTAPQKPSCSGEGVCRLTVLGLLMVAGCPNSVIIFQVT